MARFKPSREDLSENPKKAENLLRGFHGRDVKRKEKLIFPDVDLTRSHLLGKSDIIFYQSDKRDPKDPKGEGAQGYMKRFYHEQEKPAYLYVICDLNAPGNSFLRRLSMESEAEGLTKKLRKNGLYPKGPLPKKIVELGVLEKVKLECGGEVELGFKNYKIYCWDNMKTLMGIGIDNGQFVMDKVFIWCSNYTKVNWRGIIL